MRKVLTKDVISVLAITRGVASAEDEGLGSIFGPVGLVVECGGVPDDLSVSVVFTPIINRWTAYLEHELWNLDGMGRGAVCGSQEVGRSLLRVRNVVLMVGGIKSFAIPASEFLLKPFSCYKS